LARRAPSVREFDAATWCWRPVADHEPDLPVADDPLNVRLPIGRGKGVEIGALFAAFRARGLEPQRGGNETDAQFAGVLARLAQGGWRVQVDPDQPTSEEDVEPDPVFGVAEGMFPRDADNSAIYGSWDRMVEDIRAMGAGHVRRVKWCDIYWGSVYPVEGPVATKEKGSYEPSFQYGKQVPAPDALLRGLRGPGPRGLNSYWRLQYLGDFLTACLAAGLKVTLTPFHSGGGSPLSANAGEDGTELRGDHELPPEGADWEEFGAARPEHQKGVRLVSWEGWDEWYWDHGSGTTSERLFQKYSIQVWPGSESADPDSTAYERECARRKSLGIAAFCTGVAEYLATIDASLREASGGDVTIYDVVEFIELGNELDGLFVLPETTDIDVVPVGPDARIVRAGANEAGRYMALLAGPFKRLLPEMRFRASELLSQKPAQPEMLEGGACEWSDTAPRRRAWLVAALRFGMDSEVTVWRDYQSALWAHRFAARALSDEVAEWVDTCESAGFYWPPEPGPIDRTVGFSATDLVHEVGFHWYHGYDAAMQRSGSSEDRPYLYFDAERLQRDVEAMRAEVVEPLAAVGFNLTISIGEIGFAATWPSATPVGEISDNYYTGSNALFQGAMLLRLLAVARAAGVAHIYWFCHYLKPATADGTSPSRWAGEVMASGLHNDLHDPPGTNYTIFASTGAWRRPSWFAFRRLTWLFEQARTHGVRLYTNERGLTAIRFRMRSPLTHGPTGQALGIDVSFEYAWVLWLDQYSDSACLHPGGDGLPPSVTVFLWNMAETSYAFLPIVPAVEPDSVDGDRATYEYKPAIVDWYFGYDIRDPEWRNAVRPGHGVRMNSRGVSYIQLTLSQADPADAPNPVCILTNASELAFS
jgi:hypothetical protein